MHAPDMQIWNEITQQLEVEKEGMQEELEHGAYGVTTTLKQIGRGQHIGTQSAQILCAALSKSEMAKGILKKDLAVLQRRAPDTGMDQVGISIALHSTATSLNYCNDVSQKDLGFFILFSPVLLGQSSPGCSRQPCLCAWLQPESSDCQIVSWHSQND